MESTTIQQKREMLEDVWGLKRGELDNMYDPDVEMEFYVAFQNDYEMVSIQFANWRVKFLTLLFS